MIIIPGWNEKKNYNGWIFASFVISCVSQADWARQTEIKEYLYVKAASNLDNDLQSELHWNCVWNKIKLVFTECQRKRALVCKLINAAHKMVLLLPFMKPRSATKHIEFVTNDRLDQINDKEQINICFDAWVIWPHTLKLDLPLVSVAYSNKEIDYTFLSNVG